jgi:deazaflavin-dependent oxidoreductase (nitroreductase family)
MQSKPGQSTGLDGLRATAGEQFCYLTTLGRKTGNPHTIEIWFALSPDSPIFYILSGGGDRSDWVKNIRHNPNVQARIKGTTFEGGGRIVQSQEEDRMARKLVVAKYYGREEVHSTGWEATSLPMAIDLKV